MKSILSSIKTPNIDFEENPPYIDFEQNAIQVILGDQVGRVLSRIMRRDGSRSRWVGGGLDAWGGRGGGVGGLHA